MSWIAAFPILIILLRICSLESYIEIKPKFRTDGGVFNWEGGEVGASGPRPPFFSLYFKNVSVTNHVSLKWYAASGSLTLFQFGPLFLHFLGPPLTFVRLYDCRKKKHFGRIQWRGLNVYSILNNQTTAKRFSYEIWTLRVNSIARGKFTPFYFSSLWERNLHTRKLNCKRYPRKEK